MHPTFPYQIIHKVLHQDDQLTPRKERSPKGTTLPNIKDQSIQIISSLRNQQLTNII